MLISHILLIHAPSCRLPWQHSAAYHIHEGSLSHTYCWYMPPLADYRGSTVPPTTPMKDAYLTHTVDTCPLLQTTVAAQCRLPHPWRMLISHILDTTTRGVRPYLSPQLCHPYNRMVPEVYTQVGDRVTEVKRCWYLPCYCRLMAMVNSHSRLEYHRAMDNLYSIPDSKVHRANMGPIWGRQDPDGPHAGHTNLAIWDIAS